jgi:hypothetical protein
LPGIDVFLDGVEAVESNFIEADGLSEVELDRTDGIEILYVGPDEGVLGFL